MLGRTGVALAAALLNFGCSSPASAPKTGIPFGLWAWNAEKPSDTLSIVLKQTEDGWTAKIDSEDVTVAFEDDQIEFSTTDGQEFRGRLSADRSQARGFWYQPEAPYHYQAVATPVVISAGGLSTWSAKIAIQPRPYRMFLDVFEGEDGEPAAVLRNPEGNDTLGASRFKLSENNGEWSLVNPWRSDRATHHLRRTKDGDIILRHDRVGANITLTRIEGSLRSAYGPWDQASSKERSITPAKLEDGWSVANPIDVGVSAEGLAKLTQRLASSDPRLAGPNLIHSVLVSRKSKLVYEEYFFGHDRKTRHDVRSLGKVFGSVLVGALQQKGHAIGPDHRPIAALLKKAGKPLDDPKKAKITLAHLMTYTSGLDCDGNSSSSAGTEGKMWDQTDEPNYWLFTAQLDLLHEPGKRYAYCSGSANLVGASLAAFDERPVHQLFDDLVAKPLDFGSYHWPVSPNRQGYLGGGMYMLPRDILKVGAMYAADGVWNGTRIVPQRWVETSTKPKVPITPETTGMTREAFQNNYFPGSQALIWSVHEIISEDRPYTAYQASGNGGQLLIIVPQLKLAVAISGGNYQMGSVWGKWRDAVLGRYVIPSIIDK